MWNAVEIDAALHRPPPFLALPPDLEAEYDRRFYDLSRRQILVVLLSVLFLTLAGFVSDAAAGLLAPALYGKLLVQVPAILLGIAAVVVVPLPPRLLWLAAAIPFAATVGVVAAIGLAAVPPITDRYMTIAGLALFGANLAIPFKFKNALILTGVNIALFLGIPLACEPFAAVAPYFDILLFMSVVALATSALVHNRERAQKRAFLRALTNERQTLEYQALVEEMTVLAHRDPLTGAGNRRSFDMRYHAAWRTAVLQRGEVAVLLVDIDHFKLFNDRAGHLEGDACLKAVAAAIARGASCPMEAVARYGGEEFALVLQSTGGDVAEAIRQSVEGLQIPHPGLAPGSSVTVSVGKAYARPGLTRTSPEGLIQAADEALYEAKRSGRNTVVVQSAPQSAAA